MGLHMLKLFDVGDGQGGGSRGSSRSSSGVSVTNGWFTIVTSDECNGSMLCPNTGKLLTADQVVRIRVEVIPLPLSGREVKVAAIRMLGGRGSDVAALTSYSLAHYDTTWGLTKSVDNPTHDASQKHARAHVHTPRDWRAQLFHAVLDDDIDVIEALAEDPLKGPEVDPDLDVPGGTETEGSLRVGLDGILSAVFDGDGPWSMGHEDYPANR